jgi:hypothetical protein
MGIGTTAWRTLAWWVLASAIVAGVIGVCLSAAGVDSTARSALVLIFYAVVPTMAIFGLLRSFDRFARIILACTANVVILTLIATVMLAEGVWSPVGGLLVVAGVSAACLVIQWTPVRQRVAAKVTAWRDARRDRVIQTNSAEEDE